MKYFGIRSGSIRIQPITPMRKSLIRISCIAGLSLLGLACSESIEDPIEDDPAFKFENGKFDELHYVNLRKTPQYPVNIIGPDGEYDDRPCEVFAPSNVFQLGNKTVTYLPDGASPRSADWTALNPLTDPIVSPDDLKITVINIVRVNGKPYYRYLSNGTQNDRAQTWSSSKFIAFGAMASQLRYESNGKVGIDGTTVDTRGGRVPIGDLVSIATIYRDKVGPYTSNNLGTWALNVTGRDYATNLIQTWLDRPGDTLQGGYGENNSGLGETFYNPNGEKYTTKLNSNISGDNQLSTLAFADFLRRLVLHRELQALDLKAGNSLCDHQNMTSFSLPCATWSDVKAILYGASPKQTKYFNDRKVGGMMGGMSAILHVAASGGNQDNLDKWYKGNWKIFTKVGWGPDGTDYKDTRWHAYGCFPKYDSNGNPTIQGKEFVISILLNRHWGVGTAKADRIITDVTKVITRKILDGTLK